MELVNPSPVIHEVSRSAKPLSRNSNDELDATDVYEIICSIKDPEHPYTLEQLKVVSEDMISVEQNEKNCTLIRIEFTPTVPHCSLATTIGLCIREKLRRELTVPYKLDIFVTPGTHSTEEDVNKQINDKERVAAAMENPYLRPLVDECISVMSA